MSNGPTDEVGISRPSPTSVIHLPPGWMAAQNELITRMRSPDSPPRERVTFWGDELVALIVGAPGRLVSSDMVKRGGLYSIHSPRAASDSRYTLARESLTHLARAIVQSGLAHRLASVPGANEGMGNLPLARDLVRKTTKILDTAPAELPSDSQVRELLTQVLATQAAVQSLNAVIEHLLCAEEKEADAGRAHPSGEPGDRVDWKKEDWEAHAGGLLTTRLQEIKSISDLHKLMQKAGYPHSCESLYRMKKLLAIAEAANVYKPTKKKTGTLQRGHKTKDGHLEAYDEGPD
jgi:hypothetical protein